MMRLRTLTGLVVCSWIGWAVTAQAADAVVDWNVIAANAVVTAIAGGRAGQGTGIDLAKVHLAIFDAVQAIEKRFTPYHVHITHAKGSRTAATAQAAHDVLVSLYPSQKDSLDSQFNAYLTAHHIASDDPGLLVGQQSAAAILALRANDGAYPAVPPPAFIGGTGPGEWRPDAVLQPASRGAGRNATRTASQFRADGGRVARHGRAVHAQEPVTVSSRSHPPLTSPEYTRNYDEVKSLGELSSATRTAEQTDLGYFFADNFVLI